MKKIALTISALIIMVTVSAAPQEDKMSYKVPRTVGVNLMAADKSKGPIFWWVANSPLSRPNSQHVRKIRRKYGISAVGLLLAAHPWEKIYENIRKLFRLPGIDIISFRPEHWGLVDERCNGGLGVLWTEYPTGPGDFHQWEFSIFDGLYWYYSYQDKDIFVTNIEADWQLHGFGCRGRLQCVDSPYYYRVLETCEEGSFVPSIEYGENVTCEQIACDETKIAKKDYMLTEFNRRQAAVMRARAENPHAVVRVWHSIEVNFYETRPWQFMTVLCDIIPEMDVPPDFIGLSLYKMADDPVDALHYAMECTGLPANRFYIAEVGARRGQYDIIYNTVDALFNEGVAFALVWDIDVLPNDTDYSVVDPHTGTPRGGMDAIDDLNDKWEER